MPGPFPGMDPYLEDPLLWPGVHHLLITYTGTTLNALLPSRYVARIGERLYVVGRDREIYPDVALRERPPAHRPPEGSGPAAAAVASDPPWELSVEPVEVREAWVEIVAVADPGQVVTIVEVLSPANKAAGSAGRQLYRTKQREVLAGPIHLLEIDLLRQGEHTVAAPREQLLHRGSYHYLVSLSRGGRRNTCQAWGRTVRERLPRVQVPLAGEDADLVLDLQGLLDRVYDEGAFSRQIDYGREPAGTLPRADAEWADALLREKGLR